ncbi:hypothetical protein ACFFH6_20750 [Halomonas organivorans]
MTPRWRGSCCLPASSFQLPASSFQLPASSFQLPASSFQLPASSFQLPASSFQHCLVGARHVEFARSTVVAAGGNQEE